MVDSQSTEEGWERNSWDLLAASELVLGQSADLRALLGGAVLRDTMRHLKTQAEEVDLALGRNVADLEQCIAAMQQELYLVSVSSHHMTTAVPSFDSCQFFRPTPGPHLPSEGYREFSPLTTDEGLS